MEKITFTKEHQAKLEALATRFLFDNTTFQGSMNTNYTVNQLIHDTTIRTLEDMLAKIKTAKTKLEGGSKWRKTLSEQNRLQELSNKEDFIDLLIGYKLYKEQEADLMAQKAKLKAEIEALKEDAMTPAERIKAKEETLKALGE